MKLTNRFWKALFVLQSVIVFLFTTVAVTTVVAQRASHILYGDLHIDERQAEGHTPLSFDIVLYSENGNTVGRQSIPNGGRYRFMDLENGYYNLVIEVEGSEVTRIRVRVFSTFRNDFRQDIALEWRSRPTTSKASTVAANAYQRSGPNQKLFSRAEDAMTAKKYDEAIMVFEQLITVDAADYEAWTELGTAYLANEKRSEAERAYLHAADVKPTFILPLINLGRLRLQERNYEAAAQVLDKAVGAQPTSAEANLLLGEAYLQTKKGSKAVPYLTEAARLGRPEAHLRLATLYNAAGMKDKAAFEYEQFLKKRPDYADRKKLEKYIAENKKN
jgi:tetratricopeptide (TPR) repeat protein